jgi:type VI secretion system protein ImpJ
LELDFRATSCRVFLGAERHIHIPTPPRQIRAVSRNVYFILEKNSALWREFSTAPAIGMHFAGDWPDLKMELWAIVETRA